MKRKRTKIAILVSIVTLAVILIGVWLWLPYILLNKVNGALTSLSGYNGSARSVDVSLWRGSYTIHDLSLYKKSGDIPEPFFEAASMTIGIDWKSLLKGNLSSELVVTVPVLNYVNGADEKSTQIQMDNHWLTLVTTLLPLPLNRFTLAEGSIRFRDQQSTPPVSLRLDSITLSGVNLLNIDNKENRLPATVTGSGIHATGTVGLSIRLDPSEPSTAFEMHAEINALQLATMQDFIHAYGHCDVEKGTLSLFIEAASNGSSVTGSVRPVFTDLEAAESKKILVSTIPKYPVAPIVWKTPHLPTGPVAEFKVEGNLTDSMNVWTVIGETLRHASYYAVIPTIQHTVALKKAADVRKKANTRTVLTAKAEEKKGFFKRLFRKNEPDVQTKRSRNGRN